MDTKKYIIEIPDNTAWLQWVKVSDKDGHVCFDFKDPEDLTPYTEPDLDAVRNEAYKEAYDKGYQDAVMKIGSNEQAIAEKAYQRGLNDAWECARKIIEEAPAEDVVPVRHGRWKKIGTWGRVYRCNQCGNFLDFDGVNAGLVL